MKPKIILLFVILANVCVRAQCPPVTGFEICGVTADTGGTHTVLMWDKTNFHQVDTFLIHRQTSPGVYMVVGKVPYDSLSWFHDYGANPTVDTFNYKMGVIDTCGNRFDTITAYHRTTSVTANGFGQFQWNYYHIQGDTTPWNTYYIWVLERDSLSNGVWARIDSVPWSQLVLNDPGYANQVNPRYRVEMEWSRNCVATFRMSDPNQAQSLSLKMYTNIVKKNSSAIKEEERNPIRLYPNPVKDIFYFEGQGAADLQVIDFLGTVVLRQPHQPGRTLVDVSTLSSGIYLLRCGDRRLRFIKE